MEYVNDNIPLKSAYYVYIYIIYIYACICRLNMWVNTCYCGFVDLAIAAHVLKDSASHSECHRKDSCLILHDTAWILHIINAQLQDWRIGQIMFQQDSRRYRNPFWCLWMQPISKKNVSVWLWVQWLHDTFWKETDFQKTEIPLASPPTTTKETLVIGVVQLWQIMYIYIYIYIYTHIISYYVCMYIYINIYIINCVLL